MRTFDQLKKKNITSAILATILTLVSIIIEYNPVILYIYIAVFSLVVILTFIIPNKYPKVYYLIVLPMYVFIQILLAIILIVI
ncbi:hypothetical protein [Acholeplasma palmae]|uniref:hypothetical protein n=1 Tax=Acholeplasma palmae TaxID=38986 RepID=UPI0005FA7E1C|nr:hypothetical protein [Alteracholeplasma palmae]